MVNAVIVAGVTVHESLGVSDLKAHEVHGGTSELQQVCHISPGSISPSDFSSTVSENLTPYQILACHSHLHLGKDMSEGTPEGILGWA